MDDGSTSDFDATLILATMTVSQLVDSNGAQQPASSAQHAEEPRAAATSSPALDNVSNHTKIWSDLSGAYVSGEMLLLNNGDHITGMPSFAELGAIVI